MSATAPPSWLPVIPSLRIGVVGHTVMPSTHENDLALATRSLFSAILLSAARATEQARGLYSDGPIKVRLISCMALGFDTLAANVWHDLERDPISRVLEQADDTGPDMRAMELAFTRVLPQPPHVYANRQRVPHGAAKPEEARGPAPPTGHQGASESTVYFDAPDEDDDGTNPHDGSLSRQDWQAAQFLVHHTDVLIAYWNGDRTSAKEGQTSCTFRAIQLAVRLGIPVLWIRAGDSGSLPETHDPDVLRLQSLMIAVHPKVNIASHRICDEDAHEAVQRARITDLLAPYASSPEAPSRKASAEDRWLRELLSSPPRLVAMTWAFLWERDGKDRDASAHSERDVNLLRHQEEMGPLPRATRLEKLVAEVWPGLMSGVKRALREKDASSTAPSSGPIWQEHALVDARAISMMTLYRGAFILIYALGPLAVALGALAYVFKQLGDDFKIGVGAAVGLELLVVLLILFLHVRMRVKRWHVRAVECRLVAELLRHQHWLWALGRPGRLVTHRAGARMNQTPPWMHWRHDALTRSLDPAHMPGTQRGVSGTVGNQPPPRRITVDSVREVATTLDREWLQSQIAYHRNAHRRHHWLAEYAEAAVTTMFLLVLFAVGVSLVLFGLKVAGMHLEGWAYSTSIILLLLAAVALPALAAAFHGIAVQGEFERLAATSHRLERRLSTVSDQVQRAAAHASFYDMVADLEHAVSDGADAMLAELQEWGATYQSHRAPL